MAGQVQKTFPTTGQPLRVLLPEAIADTIAEAIAAKRLLPGQRIVETTAAGELGVSRVPLREALKVLHAQGILEGVGHKGYRVARFDQRHVRHVLETRLALETFLLRDAILAWSKGEAGFSGLDEAIRGMEAAAATGDAEASLRADLAFHRAICVAAGNAVAATLWNAIARHVLIIFSDGRYRASDLAAVAGKHVAFRDRILSLVRRRSVSESTLRSALAEHFHLDARETSDP